jgi:hypothetical protein
LLLVAVFWFLLPLIPAALFSDHLALEKSPLRSLTSGQNVLTPAHVDDPLSSPTSLIFVRLIDSESCCYPARIAGRL